jgi:hypothetical protein
MAKDRFRGDIQPKCDYMVSNPKIIADSEAKIKSAKLITDLKHIDQTK